MYSVHEKACYHDSVNSGPRGDSITAISFFALRKVCDEMQKAKFNYQITEVKEGRIHQCLKNAEGYLFEWECHSFGVYFDENVKQWKVVDCASGQLVTSHEDMTSAKDMFLRNPMLQERYREILKSTRYQRQCEVFENLKGGVKDG